jgi:hypothetical protein
MSKNPMGRAIPARPGAAQFVFERARIVNNNWRSLFLVFQSVRYVVL